MNALEKITEAQDRILVKLVECENAIGELYHLYSTVYPGMTPFWERLSKEKNTPACLKSSEMI